jgi:hypothetical protein
MIKFSSVLALFSVAIFGCTKICDEPNVNEINAFSFELKSSGDNSFTEDDINQSYLVRYFIAFGDSLTFPQDTIYLQGTNPIKLANFEPFRNDSIAFVRYNYAIGFENNDTLKYVLTQIKISGKYVGECAYENELKRFTLNGQTFDVTGKENPFLISK